MFGTWEKSTKRKQNTDSGFQFKFTNTRSSTKKEEKQNPESKMQQNLDIFTSRKFQYFLLFFLKLSQKPNKCSKRVTKGRTWRSVVWAYHVARGSEWSRGYRLVKKVWGSELARVLEKPKARKEILGVEKRSLLGLLSPTIVYTRFSCWLFGQQVYPKLVMDGFMFLLRKYGNLWNFPGLGLLDFWALHSVSSWVKYGPLSLLAFIVTSHTQQFSLYFSQQLNWQVFLSSRLSSLFYYLSFTIWHLDNLWLWTYFLQSSWSQNHMI